MRVGRYRTVRLRAHGRRGQMGVRVRADMQRVRHRVRLQRTGIEDRYPSRSDRKDRLPLGPRPGPDEDRHAPSRTSRPARLRGRRVQRRGRRTSVPRIGGRATRPCRRGRGRGGVPQAGGARPFERRYIADVGRLQPAADGERDARHGSPRRWRPRSQRAHPSRELLARPSGDGASLLGVRDRAMSILETETPAYRSWAEIYREHGHELPRDRWLEYIGREAGWFDALAHLESLVTAPFDREVVRNRREER